MTAPTLYDMASGLLELTKQALVEAGLPVPARQVIYTGQIPADCEQLAVVFGGWGPTPPADGMVVCQSYRWAADFTVLITRKCVPGITATKTIPSAADMSATAKRSSDDAEALLDVVSMVGEHGGDVAVSTAAPAGGLQSVILEINLPVTRGLAVTWPMT